MRDIKVRIRDLDMHVVDHGGAGKETILLLHGLTANARYWDAVAERLLDEYRVLAPDLRGRGDSAKPPEGYYDSWQYARDIKELSDTLNLERIVFIGHSMGALTGVVFASCYPESLSRLVLVDGGLDHDQEELALLLRALSFRLETLGRVFPSWHYYLELMKKNPNHAPWNDYIERYYWHDVRHLDDGSVVPKTPRHAVLPFEQREQSSAELAERIRVPTLMLQAPAGLLYTDGQVAVVPPGKGQSFISKLPEGSRFVQIDGSNHHSIILNYHERLVSEVKSFLENTACR